MPRTHSAPDQRKRLSGAFLIQIDAIEPDPEQPRKKVDAEHIRELASSIRKMGVLQPISVRFVEESNRYRVIAGECRYRASREAGLTEIPCWVRTPEENEILLQQVIENWQRSELNPFELADSLAILRDSNGYNQQQLAEVTGKSKGEISKILAILDLPPEVQHLARSDSSGKVTKRHLYTLRQFDESRQARILAGIQEGRYTSESLETLLVQHNSPLNTEDAATGSDGLSRPVRPPSACSSVSPTSQARTYWRRSGKSNEWWLRMKPAFDPRRKPFSEKFLRETGCEGCESF